MATELHQIRGVAEVLLATSPDLIGITDEVGTLRFVNDAARLILGFEPCAMVGSSVFDFLHPDEVDDAANSLAATAARDYLHAVPMQLRVRAADGTWLAMEVVATNLLSDPTIHGMVFSCRDVSYRSADERRLRVMFEQSPVAQALSSPNRKGVIANAAFARLFATTREALLDTHPEELIHPDDRERALQDRARLEAGGTPSLIAERRYVRLGGEVFVGKSALSALHSADGTFEYLFVTIEDVTLALEEAEQLARREAQARALIDNSPDIITVLRRDGTWDASVQGSRPLGYPRTFDPPGGIMSLLHPDDAENAAEAIAQVFTGERPPNLPLEVRLRAADGTYHPYECVGQNFEENDHIEGIVITARDISERKLAEAKLRQAQERFHAAFEHAPMIVSIVDLDGRILDINETGCEILRTPRAELIGQAAELIIHPDDRALAIEITTRQITGDPTPAEFRLVTAGEELFVLSQAELVTNDDDPDKTYLITLQVDITERKRLEQELERRATHDDLTGLHNRAGMNEHLERALERRARPSIAVLFIDLDDFKAINDSLGHDAGDVVLREIADRILAASRTADLVARWGGDEFVVACESAGSESDARRIADRVHAALS